MSHKISPLFNTFAKARLNTLSEANIFGCSAVQLDVEKRQNLQSSFTGYAYAHNFPFKQVSKM